MKCPVCGCELELLKVDFTEFTQIVAGKCPSCSFQNNWAEITQNRKGEVFLTLLKTLLNQGLLKNVLDASETKKLHYLLIRLDNKLDKINPLEVTEPEQISDLERFFRMKGIIVDKLERAVRIGTPLKTLLEEMKLLDQNIVSERSLQKFLGDDQKVFIFEFDGKDHTADVENADKPV